MEAGLAPSERERMRRALSRSAAEGTSSGLLLRVPRAAAKTGTGLTADGELWGWCAGFYPENVPRYAFAVAVSGASARRGAVPRAAELLGRLAR